MLFRFSVSGPTEPILAWTENHVRFRLVSEDGYLPLDFALDDEDDLKGEIATASLGIYHRTGEHVRFGLTLRYFKIDVEWGNGAGFDRVRYEYYGPSLGVAATF